MKLAHCIIRILPCFIVVFLMLNQAVKAQNSVCNIDDWTALKQLYNSTNGNNWDNNTNWNMVFTARPQSFCDLERLFGVTLNGNGRVATVDLMDNNLSGVLPMEIGNLTEATDINLSSNNLTGTIPKEFSNLTSLEVLNLSNSQLIGSIPSSFVVLSMANGGSLMELILQFNNLAGCYPSDLSNLCAQSYYGGFISAGNNFDASWDAFCTNNSGACSCSTNLSFLATATHSTNNVLQAGNKITSSATVNSNVFVVYEAGYRIRLNAGFKASPNTTTSKFLAQIDPCN